MICLIALECGQLHFLIVSSISPHHHCRCHCLNLLSFSTVLATKQLMLEEAMVLTTKPVWRSRIPRLYRRRTLLLRLFAAYFIVLPVALWLFLILTSVARYPVQLRDAEMVLVVVAHPDDESLFFGPTILSLTQRRAAGLDTALLVLSSGTLARLLKPFAPPRRPKRTSRIHPQFSHLSDNN